MAVENINKDLCVGCGECYRACSADVIRMDKKTGKAAVTYPEDCVLCAWCILSCPVHAIIFNGSKVSPVFTSWG